MMGAGVCGGNKNNRLKWTPLGKPQAIPGPQYLQVCRVEGCTLLKKGGFGSTLVVSWELRCEARLGVG